MEVIHVFSDGRIERKSNTLSFIDQSGNRKYVPVENVKQMYFYGEVELNKRALEFFTEKEIIAHFFNRYGYYVGSYYPREHYNSSYVLVKQVETAMNNEKKLYLARELLKGAVRNMLRNLTDYNSAELEDIASGIRQMTNGLSGSGTIDELMGVEANIRQAYYSAFNYIIKNKDFEFKTRTKRPPEDSINALLSFGNSLLYTAVLSEIYKTHLDPRIGFLHANNHRRFTLNLDVAEIFKPIIVDRMMFSLINKGQIKKKHFVQHTNGIYLNEEGKKIVVEEFENRLESTIWNEKLKRNVSYRTVIRMELYKIEKFILEGSEYKPFVRA
ncbi:MAG: type I-B CRISPR-associated endonuclease Cas1b [Fervidobacterium sp.]|uniref:type I-B CRISPR-associated endonuclease Cas1b n=1 Tax=Fervidobacterium sp. TaxID=1871331 RepID=UPI00404B9413